MYFFISVVIKIQFLFYGKIFYHVQKEKKKQPKYFLLSFGFDRQYFFVSMENLKQ